MTPILYLYQRRYLADTSRFKAGMWSRQTGKTFTTTLEAVLDVLEAEADGRVCRWTILSVSQARALDAMDNGVKLHLRAIAEASRASIGQKRWADEVRAKLEEVERVAQKAGRQLDAETLRLVKEGLYGG